MIYATAEDKCVVCLENYISEIFVCANPMFALLPRQLHPRVASRKKELSGMSQAVSISCRIRIKAIAVSIEMVCSAESIYALICYIIHMVMIEPLIVVMLA